MYTRQQLERGLRSRVIGTKLFVFDSIDSTNRCVKSMAEAGSAEGAVVIADTQTAGRGRHGRTWTSEPGMNLLFSVLLRPGLHRDQSHALTFFAAVAVCTALEEATGASFECKWPNDILLHGGKCCGILLENSPRGETIAYSVIGIGLNVNQREFPGVRGHRATSLAAELNVEFDRKQLFQKLIHSLDGWYHRVKAGSMDEVMNAWLKRCTMFGKPIEVRQENRHLTGTAVGLSGDGGLILETPAGRSVLYAGDVTLIPAP